MPREAVRDYLPGISFFNLIKGGMNAGLAMLLYKPIVTALRSVGMAPPSRQKKGRFNWSFVLLSIAVLALFVFLFLIALKVI